MKLSCAIVQDLLPLYEEDLCSPETKEALQLHLNQCPRCAGRTRTVQIEEFVPDNVGKFVSRSFRKVRRRWIASILLVAIMLPLMCGVAYLGWNEYHKEGLCFSNLDDVSVAKEFVGNLVAGKFSLAAEALQYTEDYQSVRDALMDTVEDNLPWVQPVHIGNQQYMVSRQIAPYAESMRPMEFWEWLMSENQGRIWIPLDIFREITKYHGTWEGDVWYGDYEAYVPVETRWGIYMTQSAQWEEISLMQENPVECCYSLLVYPQAMYQENLVQIQERAQACWESSQNWNAPYANMSLEEYTQVQRNAFVTDMEGLGLTIRYKGIGNIYWMDGWVVPVRLLLSRNGESIVLQLDLQIHGDVVNIVGGVNPPNPPTWIDNVWNCLY